VEWIGHYDPIPDPPQVTLKEDRALEWLRKGAQPTEPVERIFRWTGIYEKVNEE
jgi:small subunit ribosomal protein S16